MDIENHPLQPFLPGKAVILMLGSFPPDKKRWCMDFFYPNFQNDMWRIFGYVFFRDKDHFIIPGQKTFDKHKIEDFLISKGIALYDTAESVVREKENASDKFLEIVHPTDVCALLLPIPQCRTIVTTGMKASETLCRMTRSTEPKTGEFEEFTYCGRTIRHYRMPSSSRAYPRPIESKAEAYERMFRQTGIL